LAIGDPGLIQARIGLHVPPVNTNAGCSKLIWYIAKFFILPPNILKALESKIFKYFGGQGQEWIKRSTVFLPKWEGGAGLVNIKLKVLFI
jgi:hypothetical protein